MSRVPSLSDLAEQELEEAAAYYEAQSPGLASDFVEAVEREVNLLLEFPESAPIIRADVRARPLPRFPYTLLYISSRDELRILAVMHQSRRPLYWLGRA